MSMYFSGIEKRVCLFGGKRCTIRGDWTGMGSIVSYRFEYDERLGIRLPYMEVEWEELSAEERHDMILEWERIKARIPDRIMDIEREIDKKQERASQEEDWDTVCKLYEQIYALASVINDLHIWARVNQDFDTSPGISEEHGSREK